MSVIIWMPECKCVCGSGKMPECVICGSGKIDVALARCGSGICGSGKIDVAVARCGSGKKVYVAVARCQNALYAIVLQHKGI